MKRSIGAWMVLVLVLVVACAGPSPTPTRGRATVVVVVPPSPTPSPTPTRPVVFTVRAIEPSTVQVQVDGGDPSASCSDGCSLQGDERLQWEATDAFHLWCDHAAGIEVRLDDEELGALGAAHQPVDVRWTREGGLEVASGPVPTPTPDPVRGVQAVCLEVVDHYPQIPVFSQPIREPIEGVLRGLGISVRNTGTACDAALTFELRIEAVGKQYKNAPRALCYTGAEANGQVVLTLSGQEPVAVPVRGGDPVAWPVTTKCPLVREASFENAWSKAVVDGLEHFWGTEALARALWERSLRDEARRRLQELEGEAAAVLPILVEALNAPSADTSQAAEAVLSSVGLDAEHVPLLVDLLTNGEPRARKYAAEALREIGPEAASSVPALTQALKDEEWTVRRSAARSLGAFGPQAADALPALIEALGDDERGVRERVVWALVEVGPQAPGVVPALTDALEDKERVVRQLAAWALGSMGPQAAEAVPALIQTLSDPVPNVRAEVLRAVGRIGPPAVETVPALIRALEEEDGGYPVDEEKTPAVVGLSRHSLADLAHEALVSITGQDLGASAGKWEAWWETQR